MLLNGMTYYMSWSEMNAAGQMWMGNLPTSRNLERL